uniref:DUF502 domain-containing protein n=1 Tax=Ningiella ruwaisensis TaxID=2364274 RepID=UPI00109F1825|nr:DUF502 domain-containing protein [Ningiella ruwaisensis]
MLNRILMLIFKGLLTVLPIGLTLYLLHWLTISVESLVAPYFSHAFYFPGLGILSTLIFLAAVGIAVNAYVVKSLLGYGNRFFERLPLIKTLYGAIRDAVALFQVSKNEGEKRPVSVEIAPDMHVIGFITNEKIAQRVFPNQDKIPVYMPLSYQIGGYTVYVPKSKVSELDIDVETAMRLAITGGNSLEAPKSDLLE